MSKTKLYTKTLTLPNGKRKYIRAVSKEELERKYQQARLEIGAGVDVSDNTTFAEFAQMWYDTYKKPHLRDNSAANLLYVLNTHIIPQIGALPIRDVKALHIRRIMASQQGMSNSLQSKTLQYLRGIFSAAVENGMILRSPVSAELRARGEAAEEKVPLTVAQEQQLLTATKGTRAFVAVAVLLGVGLRKEELLGLMWDCVDFDTHEIKVRRTKVFVHGHGTVTTQLKSKAAKRDIPMPEWLENILRAAKQESNSTFVLSMRNGESLSDTSFKRLWGLISARTTDDPSLLGKPVDPKHPNVKYGIDFHVHPHKLRHTCITRWVEAGLDIKEVQYLAGHASPDITMRVYAHHDHRERRAITHDRIRSSTLLSSVGASAV